jgi:lysophospholipase L1-like esterase
LCYFPYRMAQSVDPVVVLVGHSFVRRLNDSTVSNLGMESDQVVLRYCYRGGASVRHSQSFHSLILSSLNFNPTVIFLHIGENDIGYMSPASIAESIISCVCYLLFRRCVSFVVVGQLLAWPCQRFPDEVRYVNHLLQAGLRSLPADRVLYWRHRCGFWNGPNRPLLFHGDGVHLSSRGMESYSRSLRYAIRQATARRRR